MFLLEVIACSLDDARAAEAGGANRLEICSRLDLDGLTPPRAMVEAVVRSVAIPIRVMVRTKRAGLDEVCRSVAELADLPIQGLVCGFLDAAGHLDFAALDTVLTRAPSHWALTIHRAFDHALGEVEEKYDAVRQHGRADRILSSGPYLRTGERPAFIAGGGITAENLPKCIAESGCREFHMGRAARVSHDATAPVEEGKVRRLRAILDA